MLTLKCQNLPVKMSSILEHSMMKASIALDCFIQRLALVQQVFCKMNGIGFGKEGVYAYATIASSSYIRKMLHVLTVYTHIFITFHVLR